MGNVHSSKNVTSVWWTLHVPCKGQGASQMLQGRMSVISWWCTVWNSTLHYRWHRPAGWWTCYPGPLSSSESHSHQGWIERRRCSHHHDGKIELVQNVRPMSAPQSSTTTGSMLNGPLYCSSAAQCQGREWIPDTSGGWRWVLVSLLRTRIETTKSPVEASRVTTIKNIQSLPHKCRKGYADFILWPRWPPSDRLLQCRTTVNAQRYSQTLTTLSNWNDQASSPKGSFCSTTMQGLIWPTQSQTLAEIQVGGSRSPSIQSKPLSLRLCHFWSP